MNDSDFYASLESMLSSLPSVLCPLSSVSRLSFLLSQSSGPLSSVSPCTSVLGQSESPRPLSAGTGLRRSVSVCAPGLFPLSSVSVPRAVLCPLSDCRLSSSVLCLSPARSSVPEVGAAAVLRPPVSPSHPVVCPRSGVLGPSQSVCPGSLPGPCPLSFPHRQSPVLRPLSVFCSVLSL